MLERIDPILAPESITLGPDVVLFDVRTGPNARAAYEAGHLEGARFADLEKDLADVPENPAQGGRHPLPTVERFCKWLGASGITKKSRVVVYDDQNGMNAAARLWWMLRAVGHEQAYVLDGGYGAAVEAGHTPTREVSAVKPEPPYPATEWLLPIAEIEEVNRARNDEARIVLDVRAAARFRGEMEPIDPIAGHIPGARNLPLTENLDERGRFKSISALRTQYGKLLSDLSPKKLIVHCGSGVTACHTLLALERAGLRGAKLYVGSWSEWCRQEERPRATGEG